MSETKEEKYKEREEVEEIPTNTVALYMYIRSKKSRSIDPYESYELLMDIITAGESLIEDLELKKEIEKFFSDQKNYPKITDMEYQGDGTYSVGTGSGGTIVVRPEELEYGERHLLRQQSAMILPRLRLLDSKIMSHLVKKGIIKSDEPEELFLKELEAKISG